LLVPSPKSTRAPSRLGLAVLALLAAALAAPTSTNAEGEVPCVDTGRCPDLTVDALKLTQTDVVTRSFDAESCVVVESMAPEGTHKLLRFTFTTPNLGKGDLVIGAPAARPEWFVWSPCHGHYHFREYADYRLWTAEGYAAWHALRAALPSLTADEALARFPDLAGEIVASEKRGFCVIDVAGPYVRPSEPALPVAPKYDSCDTNQGITVGWADEYAYWLDGQWFVVDGLAPGAYVIEAEVNAQRFYAETDYANNAAAVPVTL
jgi:hypothetical protein